MNIWTLVDGVKVMWTVRDGGVSRAPYDSLNLGSHVGDVPTCVAINRLRVQSHLLGARAVFMNQVHGSDVQVIDANTPDGLTADAALTTERGVACTMMVADCLPVLLCDARGQVVAAAHAGWRGLVGGVLENTLAALCLHAHCEASEIHAWLGPCIGVGAFEVGLEVAQAFVQSCPSDQVFFHAHADTQKRWADLAGLARARLQRAGVHHLSGNDSSAEWCTVSQPSMFFSYRRDGVTGRMAALIWRE